MSRNKAGYKGTFSGIINNHHQLMTVVDDNGWWQWLMTMVDDNGWLLWYMVDDDDQWWFMTIIEYNFWGQYNYWSQLTINHHLSQLVSVTCLFFSRFASFLPFLIGGQTNILQFWPRLSTRNIFTYPIHDFYEVSVSKNAIISELEAIN